MILEHQKFQHIQLRQCNSQHKILNLNQGVCSRDHQCYGVSMHAFLCKGHVVYSAQGHRGVSHCNPGMHCQRHLGFISFGLVSAPCPFRNHLFLSKFSLISHSDTQPSMSLSCRSTQRLKTQTPLSAAFSNIHLSTFSSFAITCTFIRIHDQMAISTNVYSIYI